MSLLSRLIRWVPFAAALLFTCPSCTGEERSASPEALAYLHRAIDIMQQNALHAERIDWEELPKASTTTGRWGGTAGRHLLRDPLGPAQSEPAQLPPASGKPAAARGAAKAPRGFKIGTCASKCIPESRFRFPYTREDRGSNARTERPEHRLLSCAAFQPRG